MQVAFIVTSFPKLSETFVLNQIVGLIDKGIDVKIFAYRQELGTFHSDVKDFDLLNRTTFLLPSFKNRYINLLARSLLAAKGWIRAKLKGHCLRFSSLADALSYYAILGRFGSLGDFDAIIAHFGPLGVQANNLINAHIISGRLITIFHGYDISRYDVLSKYEEGYKELFKKDYLFLPISQLWKEKLIEMGCDERKIRIHRMGIYPHRLANTPREQCLDDNVENKTIKIITVARMTEKKGVDIAIRALYKIASSDTFNFTYNVVGDGEELEKLKMMVAELGLSNRVVFYGSLNSTEVYELYKSSDIFILPSRRASDGDMEGIPVALMEAMWMRLITISSVHSGIPELIENDVNGFLATEDDVNSLEEKIIQAVNLNESEKLNVYNNARKTVEEKFNNDKLNKEFYLLLKRYCDG